MSCTVECPYRLVRIQIRRQLTQDHNAPQIFAYCCSEVALRWRSFSWRGVSARWLLCAKPYVFRCCIRSCSSVLFGNGRFVGGVRLSQAICTLIHNAVLAQVRGTWWTGCDIWSRAGKILICELHSKYIMCCHLCTSFVVDKVPSTKWKWTDFWTKQPPS